VTLNDHRRELDDLTTRLHDSGWSNLVSVERLVEQWERLATEVETYKLTIDDFTNDLTSRDGLDLVLAWAAVPLAANLRPRIDAADARY